MRKLTDEEKIEIVEKFKNGFTYAELGREYGVHSSSITSILRIRGININGKELQSQVNRKYSLDETYLDNIDCEDKAYFLGLMFSDGCVTDNNTISISLQEKDVGILEYYQNRFKSSRPISFVKKQKEHWQNQYKLTFNSLRLGTRLKELGCVQRKSLILKFPTEDQVPKFLLRHFIRGYFDGDGCLTQKFHQEKRCKTGNLCYTAIATITSTLDFCDKLAEIIKEELKINCKNTKTKNSETSTRVLNIYGNQQIYKFITWIYNDSNIYLDRKFEMYQQIEATMIERGLLN